jgi:hypothetical protein
VTELRVHALDQILHLAVPSERRLGFKGGGGCPDPGSSQKTQGESHRTNGSS